MEEWHDDLHKRDVQVPTPLANEDSIDAIVQAGDAFKRMLFGYYWSTMLIPLFLSQQKVSSQSTNYSSHNNNPKSGIDFNNCSK